MSNETLDKGKIPIPPVEGQAQSQVPLNYKRIKRLSRMSNVNEDIITKIIHQEFKKLKKQSDDKEEKTDTYYINERQFDNEMVKQLYLNVMHRLGITTGFESTSEVHGFTLDQAADYLLDLGYSKPYVENLKRSAVLTLISYPKLLKKEYKKKFEYQFEKAVLSNKGQIKHPVIFYAETVGTFITELDSKGIDPFLELIRDIKTLPLSALKSLYRYKFDVVLRYVRLFSKFRWKGIKNSEKFVVDSSQITGFVSCGIIQLETDNIEQALKNINIAARLKQKKKAKVTTTKGVVLEFKLAGSNLLEIKFWIKIQPRFRFYGIANVQSWVKKFVIKPCLVPPLSLRGRINNVN